MNAPFSRSFPQPTADASTESAATRTVDAELVVRGGVSEWTLRAGTDDGTLARVMSGDEHFEAHADGSRVELHHGHAGHGNFFGSLFGRFTRSTETNVRLSAERRWAVAIHGGVSNLDADLRGLDLASIDVRGGISGLVLALPAPDRVVPIRIHGGVTQVFFLRPAGVPFGVSIRGGAADVTFDRTSFGEIGGRTRWNLDLAAELGRGYLLEVDGGASTLAVTEGEPRPTRDDATTTALVAV